MREMRGTERERKWQTERGERIGEGKRERERLTNGEGGYVKR